MIPWHQALYRTAFVGMVAIAWGGVTYLYAPVFFWWLTPVIAGLVLAAPIVRYSSSITLGRITRNWGVFLCPSETTEEPVLRDLAALLKTDTAVTDTDNLQTPVLPAEIWRDMPIQSFRDWQPANRSTISLRPAPKARRTLISSRT